MIHHRTSQLLDVLAKQVGVVDLAKWIKCFTCVFSLIMIPFYLWAETPWARFDFMSDMA
jgi:hypothetical protein